MLDKEQNIIDIYYKDVQEMSPELLHTLLKDHTLSTEDNHVLKNLILLNPEEINFVETTIIPR